MDLITLYGKMGLHWCVGCHSRGAGISITAKHKAMLNDWLKDGKTDVVDKVKLRLSFYHQRNINVNFYGYSCG